MKESKRLEDEVCSSVRKAFDRAIIGADKDGVSRCARLFYPLGMTTEAVARYVRFIRQTLAEQCKLKLSSVIASNDNASTTRESNDGDRDGGVVVINDKYVNTLTNVFLAVADIIQDHQRNIEEEFGPMNFVMVLRGLQAEADTQAIAVINRIRVSRKRIMKDFENTGDEVMEDARILTSIDLGQKDAVIDEMCIIAQRCNQFEHYIHSVSRQVVAELSSEDHKKLINDGEQQGEEGRNRVKNKVDHNLTYTEDGLAVITDLTETVQDIMGEYVLYERSFILTSIIKAIHEDRIDIDDPQQMTSSVVDDVFFVLHKAIQRSLSTADIDSSCAVINHIVQVLGNEYKSICLDRPLQDSKRNFASFLAHGDYILEAISGDNDESLGQGNNSIAVSTGYAHLHTAHHHHPLYLMYRQSDGETPLDVVTSSQSWPHALSNTALSAVYVDKLRESAASAAAALTTDNDVHDKKEMFLHTIQQLEQVRSEFDELTHLGCKMCLHQVKVQYLSPALAGLDGINYDIDEDEYNDYQINDPFAQHFINETDIVLRFLRLVLPSSCINIILGLLVDQLTTRMERFLLSSSPSPQQQQQQQQQSGIRFFSILGAIQFDQDVRRLLNYFTSVSDLPVRRKFTRLLDMCTLLSLESLDEFHDIYASGGTTMNDYDTKQQQQQQQSIAASSSSSFRLSRDEIRKILLTRRFPADKVDALLRDYYPNTHSRNNAR
ncbi:Golgi transport complex subunit 4, variant 2 [Perkinsus olseni]|nr:Golgi transport complex subunit 4, variant 2 [Perkinsus olseni]